MSLFSTHARTFETLTVFDADDLDIELPVEICGSASSGHPGNREEPADPGEVSVHLVTLPDGAELSLDEFRDRYGDEAATECEDLLSKACYELDHDGGYDG